MHKVSSKGGDAYKTASFLYHPNFKNGSVFDDFDIAIVTVDRTIKFGTNAKPICLPSSGEDFTGRKVIVAGW